MSSLICSLARGSLLTVALFWLVVGISAVEDQKKPVIVEVTVPESAVVFIDGVKTKSTGSKRRFASEEVPVGKTYFYVIKGVWKGPDGKEVVREVKFHVTPDKVNELDLTREQKTDKKHEKPKEKGKES